MVLETDKDWAGMKAAAEAVAITLKKMQAYAKIGMSTLELDEYGGQLLEGFGAKSAPKYEYDFPGWTCISVNEEACHGFGKANTILKEGDLVNIDVSAEKNGYFGDNGGSFILGEDRQQLGPLVEASKEILRAAIRRIRSRGKISDLGGFIEREAKKRGFQVIKNLAGHGIGRKLHEAPTEILCYKERSNRSRFRKNTVIALETFISTKANLVQEGPDGWTMSTPDGSFVAQHEHTIVVTDGEPIILTVENGI
jgi:methionyl aminopeptidase